MKTCKCKKKFKPILQNNIRVSRLCPSCYKANELAGKKKSAEKARLAKIKKQVERAKLKPIKKKKKPLTEHQLVEKLRKKCVKLAKDIAKERDKYTCCYCGVGKPQRQIHSHHFFHEGMFKSMSADPDNLITLCASHHQGGMWMKSHGGFNFHNSPRESTEWYIENYPQRHAVLLKRSKEYKKLDMIFWEAKLEELNSYQQFITT